MRNPGTMRLALLTERGTRFRHPAARRALAVLGATAVLATALASVVVPLGAAPAAGDAGSEDAGVHQENVDFLRQRGIFAGTDCSPERFCPQESLTRWVMAVWLVRLLDGKDPKVANSSRFADVPGDVWWRPHVERLAEMGVARGCAADPQPRFCPNDAVTRAQMAVFVSRAYGLPRTVSAGFADTTDNFAEHSIDALAEAGITLGCRSDPPRFCPDRNVTRAEMATVLVRAIPPVTDAMLEPDREDLDGPFDGPFDGPLERREPIPGPRQITVPVYYCAPSSTEYTMADLRAEANKLTDDHHDVGQFYARQSSNSVSLTFTPGAILSPTGVDWATETIGSMHTGRLTDGLPPCERDAIEDADTRNILIQIDVRVGSNSLNNMVYGYALRGVGPAVVPTPERFTFQGGRVEFSGLVAHEIGHSVFRLLHPENEGKPYDCSLMSEGRWGEACGTNDITKAYLADYQKERLGWGQEEPELPPPVTTIPPPVTTPGKPTGLRVQERPGQLSLWWNPPNSDGGSPIIDYEVYGVNVSSNSNWFRTTGVVTTSWVSDGRADQWLNPGETYRIRVRARNSAGFGPSSNILATPQPTTTSQPPARDVRLTKGASAQGWTGCSSVHCRHLQVELVNFDSGIYALDCYSSLSPNSFANPAFVGAIHWPSDRLWTVGGCYFGYPGADVWVIVDGIKSNVVRW